MALGRQGGGGGVPPNYRLNPSGGPVTARCEDGYGRAGPARGLAVRWTVNAVDNGERRIVGAAWLRAVTPSRRRAR
jgi:hypothetical protein